MTDDIVVESNGIRQSDFDKVSARCFSDCCYKGNPNRKKAKLAVKNTVDFARHTLNFDNLECVYF